MIDQRSHHLRVTPVACRPVCQTLSLDFYRPLYIVVHIKQSVWCVRFHLRAVNLELNYLWPNCIWLLCRSEQMQFAPTPVSGGWRNSTQLAGKVIQSIYLSYEEPGNLHRHVLLRFAKASQRLKPIRGWWVAHWASRRPQRRWQHLPAKKNRRKKKRKKEDLWPRCLTCWIHLDQLRWSRWWVKVHGHMLKDILFLFCGRTSRLSYFRLQLSSSSC